MRARRLSGDTRRDQIAKAVLALASESGMGSVSIGAVAARVGVTPSALYRHYSSKGAMLDETLERLGQRILSNLEAARTSATNPLEAIELLLERHIALVRENRGIPIVFFSEEFFLEPRRRARFTELLSTYRAGIETLVREAQRARLVRRELDPQTLAIMFFGLFQSPAILWHLSGGRFDITGQAHRAWAVFQHGIRVPESGRPHPRGRARLARTKEKSA
jgi:AcrR family transcriptional regulator